MKYIINFILSFESDTRILALKDDSLLSIELSKPATRLLCELIENNRNTLSREAIIQNVWVDYGFTPSKANLSNHISELRKAFENLGLDNDVIITVPKIGFRMEAEIHPIVKPSEMLKDSTTLEERSEVIEVAPSSLIDEQVLSQPEKLIAEGKKKARLKTLIITAALLIISATGITFTFLPKDDAVPLVTTKDKCNIYNLNNGKPPPDFIKNVTNRIEAVQVNCTQENIDIYYTETRKANDFMKISFMAVCKKSDDTHYHSCTNYKFIK